MSGMAVSGTRLFLGPYYRSNNTLHQGVISKKIPSRHIFASCGVVLRSRVLLVGVCPHEGYMGRRLPLELLQCSLYHIESSDGRVFTFLGETLLVMFRLSYEAPPVRNYGLKHCPFFPSIFYFFRTT